MQYFRFLITTKGLSHLQALVLESKSLEEATTKAKNLIAEEDRLISINVLHENVWTVLKGVEVKGKKIEPHPANECQISPLGDAFAVTSNHQTTDSAKSESDGFENTSPTPNSGVSTFTGLQQKVRKGVSSDATAMLVSATWQAFLLCVVRIFTISWSIWKGSALRLAERQTKAISSQPGADTEFPVFEWFKSSWDGVIFLSWFIGPIVTLIAANDSYYFDWTVMFAGLAMTYFGVISLSLTKEILILGLSIALNVEKISHTTGTAEQRG